MGAWITSSVQQFFKQNFLLQIKQIFRIWVPENPQIIEERPLYLEKVTVWHALCSEDVIGPYFFENDVGTTVAINSERYGHIITDFFCLLLKNTTWRISCFNETVSHATQLEQIWLYCKRHFLAA